MTIHKGNNMKINKVLKVAIYLFAMGFVFLAVACATTRDSEKISDSGFEYYELKNGIPLIIKTNVASNMVALQISVAGGPALMIPKQSGLEESLFKMMAMGSENYDYQTVQQTLYEKVAQFSSTANTLGSTLSITTIDYYFEDLLPIFIDGFLHPAFGEAEFTTLMAGVAQSLSRKQEDPDTLLLDTIKKTRYKNHPYETDTSVILESYNSITIDAMKEHLTAVLNAERIALIAVGNFDGKDLVQKLNSTLGELPSSPFDTPAIPLANHGGAPIIQKVDGAKGTGYVAYSTPAPLSGTTDEMAVQLATMIYNEILFNLVREQYGATYSIASAYRYSKAPYILMRAYKVSDLKNIKMRIEEAEAFMAEGKIVSGKNAQTGEFEFSTIDERLEGYKNTFINQQFYAAQTNSAIASKIREGLLLYENPESYLEITEKIHAVTADDIIRAFNTYFMSDKKQWFAVVGPDEEILLNLD